MRQCRLYDDLIKLIPGPANIPGRYLRHLTGKKKKCNFTDEKYHSDGRRKELGRGEGGNEQFDLESHQARLLKKKKKLSKLCGHTK